VYGVRAAVLDGFQNRFGIEVALGCCLAAKGIRLISETHVKGIAIKLGVDRNGGNSHLSGSSDNTDGNFAAIGDKDFLQHR
jgi:hypothetical protein